jgi:uncharacterized protein
MLSPLNPYTTFNNYLQNKFGQKVYKVSLDAGFDCPNRDGRLAVGGCTYCDEGSRAPGIDPTLSIRNQMLAGMENFKRRYKSIKFLAYFQSFTNTYDKVEVLRQRYLTALDMPDVIGLAVSTRPDCISQGALKLLDEISNTHEVWLELGLQSIHDKTIEKLNRWHTYKQFEKALWKAKEKSNIKICTHLIFGLPGESIEQMHQTIDQIVKLPIDGLKLHIFHVIKNTALYNDYKQGQFSVFKQEDYVPFVCDVLEKIPSSIIIQRLTGEAEDTKLVAPRWALYKGTVINRIKEEFKRRETYQGCKVTQQ